MPDKKGRITGRERTFVQHMARTGDATYAAEKAGYAQPQRDGWRNMQREEIARMTREEALRFAREEAGGIGLVVLVAATKAPDCPWSQKVAAAKELVKVAGIGAADEAGGKEFYEMSVAELARENAAATARLAVVQGFLANAAKPVIEGETLQNSPPGGDAFE